MYRYLLALSIINLIFLASLGATPNSELISAASKADDSGVETALKNGASVDFQTDKGHSAVMFSVKSDCEDCLEILIEAKANLDLVARANNQTALMLAIQEEKYDMAILLLKNGANPDIIPKGAFPAIVYAIKAKNDDLIEALLAANADLNFTTSNGKSLLHQATQDKDVDLMKLLLKNGANPNSQTSNGTTPLMLASHAGCIECVELLLKSDADPLITNKKNAKAIDFASSQNHRDIIILLDPDQEHAASLDEDQAVLFITLIDTLKIPDAGVICRLQDPSGDHKIEGRTDSKGQIKDVVYKGRSYTISCDKFGREIRFDTPLDVKKTDRPLVHKEILQITVTLKPLKSYALEGINFASGSAKIVPDPNKALDDLYDVMDKNSKMEIMITGHTDSQGGKEYNIDLSRRRAVNVMNYLINKGIDKSRLSAKGYGPNKPIASNANAEGRAKNRRIMVEVIKE